MISRPHNTRTEFLSVPQLVTYEQNMQLDSTDVLRLLRKKGTVAPKGEEPARETHPLVQSCRDFSKPTRRFQFRREAIHQRHVGAAENSCRDSGRLLGGEYLRLGLENVRLLCCTVKLIVNVCRSLHRATISSPGAFFLEEATVHGKLGPRVAKDALSLEIL